MNKFALAIICSVCIPRGCSSFQQQRQSITTTRRARTTTTTHDHDHDHTRRQRTYIQSTISDSTDKSIFNIDDTIPDDGNAIGENQEGDVPNISSSSSVQLWLDLRGTSLTPKSALELWALEEQLQQQQPSEMSNSQSKVPFTKCIMSTKNDQNQKKDDSNSNQNNGIDIDILLASQQQDDDDDNMNNMSSIYQYQHSNLSSSPIGKILALQASSSMPILPDPLPSIELVSSGKWVIIDTNGWKKMNDVERMDMVLPLVDLLSSGNTISGGGGGGGSRGGIGLTCHTNEEVVKAAMYFNGGGGGYGGSNGRTKTLESGIVIPDSDEDAADDQKGDVVIEHSSCCGYGNVAIVVPFDMALLQTAKLLLDV